MEVYALGPEDGALACFEDRRGRLEEEERFLGADVVELFDVVSFGGSGVISSNADDFSAIGRYATRGHLDNLDIQCP